jgi:alpha-galactosidase
MHLRGLRLLTVLGSVLGFMLCSAAQSGFESKKGVGEMTGPVQCVSQTGEVVASYVPREIQLEAANPVPEWQSAQPIIFCSDWQGKNPDEQRQTQVRVLWSPQTLYLRFECRYRDLYVFESSDPDGRRDHLWDRDVVEAFLQPDPSRERYYREFEASPNGMWIDLDIFPGGLADLKSGMQRSVTVDAKARRWAAELAIPMKALTENFDPNGIWRANFYRVEGRNEPRTYLAWQPTGTPEPNFHVPSAFGRLRFAVPVGVK